MKAAICSRFGMDGVEVREVAQPVPRENEVLLKVRAASLNALDWHLLRGTPLSARPFLGLRRPRVERPGRDVAGRVEAVGAKVTQFKPSDEVFGICRGTVAEYACALEKGLAWKPAGVSFEQAASLPVAGLTALQGLRDYGRIRPQHKVLVNGAGGGVGTFLVQLAKWFGAEVTAVTGPANLELVRGLGADHVMDYTREDFTAGGHRYDLVLDCHAIHSLAECRHVLNANGRYIVIGGPVTSISGLLFRCLSMLVASRLGSHKFILFIARMNREDLATIAELVAAGKLTPVIDRCYALSDAPQAMRHLAEGRTRGKIVVTMA